MAIVRLCYFQPHQNSVLAKLALFFETLRRRHAPLKNVHHYYQLRVDPFAIGCGTASCLQSSYLSKIGFWVLYERTLDK